ncbi:hypothetical protein [Pseudomonas sp. Xaverov 259]|uniref:hypothetical protein n=1 Tax=Pseudomonas sp. Xaverov 259 TaxID=2666086 RepID=UPI001C5BC992|nr:hypothetical protein [Pseudomonas sp. Xaverov 259]
MTVHSANVLPFGAPKNNFPQPNLHANSAPSSISENAAPEGTEASRKAADARVEQDYLKQASAGSRVSVPPESTLGRWVTALKSVIRSSAFKQLEDRFGGQGAFTHIDHSKGEVWFDGGRKKLNKDSPELNDVPGAKALFDNLMVIAKKLAPFETLHRRDIYDFVESSHTANTVASSVVGQFISGPSPNALSDHQVPVDILRKTGEAETQHNVVAALKKQIEAPGTKPGLESITVEIAPYSVFWREEQPQPVTMNLKQLMTRYGLEVPTTLEALANLECVLFAPRLSAPSAGDYGGLHTKSVPLSEDAQKKISETVSAWKSLQTQVPLNEGGMSPSLFDYLSRAVPASKSALAETDPEAFLKALIDTPQARELGKQLQEAIGALPTSTSAQEALLTALGLEANRGAAVTDRNNLAGYNLRQEDNVGRMPAEIVKRFEAHMESIVGPKMAKVAAFQLMSMWAAEFTVKEVPPSVSFGSPQWLMFSGEVFYREQRAPGSSVGKRYDQIREQGQLQPVTLEQEYQAKAAAVQAVIDWGIATNIIKENSEGYSEETIASVTAAMEKQAKRLAGTLEGILAPLPTRQELALPELKRVYGEENADLFDKKIFSRRVGLITHSASLLDLFMSGKLYPGHTWRSNDSRLSDKVVREGINKLPNIKKDFVGVFDAYADSFSKAAGEMFLHQLSQLRSEDRKRFEFGAVEIHHLSQSKDSNFPKDSESSALFDLFGVGSFLIKTTLNGEAVEYVYSPQLGRIIKNGDPLPGVSETWTIKRSHRAPFFSLNVGGQRHVIKTIWHTVGADERPEPHILAPGNTPTDRFSTFAGKISYLYKEAVSKLKDAANGMTDTEKSSARNKVAMSFLLSLLPFHDLVSNIIKGDKHEAVISGVFDFIGLFNPAAKGGFKAVTVGAKGVSSALTFFKGAAKSGGKAAIPFKGFYDSGKGLFKLGNTALKAAPPVNLTSFTERLHLRGRSWDIPHGANTQTIADGTYRPLSNSGSDVPVVAAQRGNNWYAFDVETLQPYGPALKDFTPITVKELGNLRYDTATSAKDSDGVIEAIGNYANASSAPTPPPQPS